MGFSGADTETGRKSLYDRVSQLLESYEWSDCTFSVSGTSFKAHKLLLCISSPVFKAMFYGPLSTDKDVVICDIEPSVFQELINYIYTDKVDLISVEQAFELLYASKKYMLEYLTEKCKFYIENNISIDNVLIVLNYAEFVQEKSLFDQALTRLCGHCEYLMQSGLENMSVSTLKALLACGQANIGEKNLIKALFKWTHHYCTKNDLQSTIENRRKVLIDNGLLQLLRFKLLEPDELAEVLAPHNLLLPEEVDLIKCGLKEKEDSLIESKTKQMLSYVRIPRESLKLRWHFCHRSALRSASPLKIDNFSNHIRIRLKCDKTVFINSLGVRTRTTPQLNLRDVICSDYLETFLILVRNESDNSLIREADFSRNVEHDSTLFVDFAVPLLIKKDVWYELRFIWPSMFNCNILKYVVCHRNKICHHKATFVFDDMTDNTDLSGSFLEALKYTF